MQREFDLNIEKTLDDWEVYHAIREIIANAIDEMKLTRTKDIEINKDSQGFWHIRDYGRGLTYHHLTQNENVEKMNSDLVIGKFGVGLKDALAVLFKNKINNVISSKHGIITLKMQEKKGLMIRLLYMQLLTMQRMKTWWVQTLSSMCLMRK